MKQTILIALAVIAAALLLPGCSHNTGAFTLGTRINLGIDPQNATANASYTDGLNVIDVSRENASWDIEIDADNGVSVDDSTGIVLCLLNFPYLRSKILIYVDYPSQKQGKIRG